MEHGLSLYVVGLAFTTAGMMAIAPARREIHHFQRGLWADGSQVDLGAALVASTPGENGTDERSAP